MKNLSLVTINSDSYCEGTLPEIYCISNDELYAFKAGEILEMKSNGSQVVVDLLHTLEQDESTPVYFDAASSPESLVLCMSNGDLLTVDTSLKQTKFVGCFAPGIAAAAWSPVGDIFAVITTSFNAVLLDLNLEPQTEVELEKSGEEQPVSVGWGKEETQFRGSEGKLKERVKEGARTVHDDNKCRISWRGDGEMFAVSFIKNHHRHLRVISNDGTLLFNNELLGGLESALSWRPNGAFIASTVVSPNKRMVCFFQKNLLPHGGFEIKEDGMIDELLWNHDSSILAVVLKNAKRIQLYTVGNYHWYHKYTISTGEENIAYVKWDEIDGFMLRLVTHVDNVVKHHRYVWRWSVDCSSGCSKDDLSWAAVIDGPRVLLTGLKQAVIPPPMSSRVIELASPANSVGFLQYGAESDGISSSSLFVYCADGSISTYKLDHHEPEFVKTETKRIPDRLVTQIAWVEESKIIAYSANRELIVIGLPSLNISKYPCENPIIAIRRVPNQETAILWDPSMLHTLSLSNFEISNYLPIAPQLTSRLIATEVRGNRIFALDGNHRMYINSENVATNVTSFCLTTTHLLMTTLQHKLLCLTLAVTDPFESSERPVERGARLITTVPGKSSVILQLPRGNLEVILPRALTITTLKGLLDELNYLEAVTVMRRERVNLNLVYDHNPAAFEENINTFLDQITDSTLLCPFIAELSAENVTQTLYGNFYKKQNNYQKEVKMICALLLSGMECRHDKQKYLLPILSCLIKKGDTEQAIMKVQAILGDEKRGIAKAVSSTEGLSHILYLIDVEQLFKIALGTYDLSLVMFIASKSQKDPKEYLPFLSNLQQMEENYQKYTIDYFLKRYKKALAHLALCSDRVKDCLDLVVKHNLYRDALKLFAQDSDTWKGVCVLYGAELTRLSRHEEAGLLLQRAGEYLLARHAFARAGAWRQELFCAEALNIPEDEKAELFNRMVENLLTARRFTEAAALCLEHIGDVEAGIDALCSAHQHGEAMRVACLHKRNDLIGSLIRPSALAVCDTHEQTLNEAKENFERLLNRLRIVRLNKDSNQQDWDDTSSESSRGSSRATSTRSAKNVRKLERNLMKQGGVFENDALIAALHDIVSQTTALKSQVRAVNLALVALNEQAAAAKLQNIFKLFLDYISPGVREIWPALGSDSEHGLTSNSIAAEFGTIKRQLPGPVQALQPKVLFPPDQSNRVEWQLDILLG